ncbi:hypothetical protein [Aureimonas sp. N4]|uniref:hypothetical protein n=1 Tax=Aureimonas sp. N4 TaxID=1638165 RepID=UPI0007813C07|nr:hypothetical protein [Aureimonas sp. N4]
MTVAAYRNRVSGRYPVTLEEVRQSAGALFGDEPPVEVLEELGLDPVEALEPPTYDPTTHMLTEGDPVLSGGVWRQTWAVVALPLPPVPEEVSRRQAKRALSDAGHLTAANAAIEAIPGKAGDDARIDWADAGYFRRDNPLILGIGSALGLTEAQIDDLFRAAAAI